ncbi:MAG: hypothetical protein Q4G68_03220 [Planctomycetia bacterium]|nr:hypothetical protein [Planctomycetia bacterium]
MTGGIFTSFGESTLATLFSRAAVVTGVLWGMDLVLLLLGVALGHLITREGE